MYNREKSINFKGSTSASNNNLSCNPQIGKNQIQYAIVHKSSVNLVTASLDGSVVTTRQVCCKDNVATNSSASATTVPGNVIQTKIVTIASRPILVITSQKGINIYDVDGLLLLYWFAFPEPDSTKSCQLARGIVALLDNLLCVGTYTGSIMVLSIPARGTNISLVETLNLHSSPICDLSGYGEKLISADEKGDLIISKAGEPFEKLNKCSCTSSSDSVTSLQYSPNLDVIIVATTNGTIRMLCGKSCSVLCQIDAHARIITSLSIAMQNNLLLSTSEDMTFQVWNLNRLKGGIMEVEHMYSDIIKDSMIQGGAFLSDDGRAIALTTYDSNELFFYSKK